MLNFGFIGLGQCGNKIVDAFAKYSYPSIALNTTEKDLDGLQNVAREFRFKMPVEGNKGGAGKNPSIGSKAIESNLDNISKIINERMAQTDFIFLCAGLGGGTGSGSLPKLLEYMPSIIDKKFGVIVTLPYKQEGVETKGNAIKSLINVLNFLKTNNIPVLLIDNDKIAKKMKVSDNCDWKNVNEQIVRNFHYFIKTANNTSSHSSFDEADFIKSLSRPGIFAINNVIILEKELTSDMIIKDRILKSWQENNIYADLAFDSAQILVTMVRASESFLKQKNQYKLLEGSLNNLKDTLGSTSRYDGIYTIDDKDSNGKVYIYTLLSGMPAPMEKIKLLYDDTREDEKKLSEKIQKAKNSFDLSAFTDIGNVFDEQKNIFADEDNSDTNDLKKLLS